MKNKTTAIIKLAGAYVACAIGSGFATGQEIMQFFTGQGIMSLAGIPVTTLLFALCGCLFIRHGNEYGLSDPQKICEFYFGKYGRAVELILQIFLYGIYVIMIAGTGATLNEYFGINPVAGRILMAAAVFITVILGLEKLTSVLGLIGPVIIVFALFVGVTSFLSDPSALAEGGAKALTLDIIKTPGGWLWSSVLYASFNAVTVFILSCSMGITAPDKKTAAAGGIIGGVFFGAAILMMDLGLLVNIADVFDKYIPTLALASRIGSVFASVFSVIICLGTYTTAVPMLWGFVRHFAEDGSRRAVVITLALTAMGMLLGATDFKVLVNVIYPFSGYAGILLMAIVFAKELSLRKRS